MTLEEYWKVIGMRRHHGVLCWVVVRAKVLGDIHIDSSRCPLAESSSSSIGGWADIFKINISSPLRHLS